MTDYTALDPSYFDTSSQSPVSGDLGNGYSYSPALDPNNTAGFSGSTDPTTGYVPSNFGGFDTTGGASSSTAPATGGAPGVLGSVTSGLNGILSKLGLTNAGNLNAAQLLATILGAAQSGKTASKAQNALQNNGAGQLPAGYGSSGGNLAQYGPQGGYGYQNYAKPPGSGYAPRQQASPMPASSYYTYGQRPESQFFVPKARGGAVYSEMSAGGDAAYAHGISRHIQGPGDGTSDSIPARLATGEYVVDAQGVSMLGNGDNKAGADKLDQWRKSLRQHKGTALAKGKMAPDAKSVDSYFKKSRQ